MLNDRSPIVAQNREMKGELAKVVELARVVVLRAIQHKQTQNTHTYIQNPSCILSHIVSINLIFSVVCD
jgi:hypothetical protein